MNLFEFKIIEIFTEKFGAAKPVDCYEFIIDAKEHRYSKTPLVALHVFHNHIGVDFTEKIRIESYPQQDWLVSRSPNLPFDQTLLVEQFVKNVEGLSYDEAGPLAIKLIEDLLLTLVSKTAGG